MKILFIVPYVPSLVRTRPYNLIRGLTERGHQVTVLTLWANEQERADLERLKPYCYDVQALHMPSWRSWWNCIWALPEGVPLQSVFSWRPELVAHLNGNSTFDVVHVEHLRGARYGLRLKSQNHLPVVWDSVDSITHLFRQAAVQSKNLIGRLRSRLDLKRTERYEGWLLDKFDHVTVTSPVDKDALVSLNTNGTRLAPVSVLRNGVDLSYFSPIPAAVRKPATLVVSGKMSYHANATMVLHLVRNIMPYIWARRPDVELWIVGKDPTREVEALGQHPAVTVTGTVADIRPYLRQATIAVAPVTYGAGVQNKVLEAMACATPVVAASQATLALQTVPGRDLWVADEPSTFADSVLRLLNDPVKRQCLGEAGRSYVEAYHNWTNIAGQLEQIYNTAIHPQQRD